MLITACGSRPAQEPAPQPQQPQQQQPSPAPKQEGPVRGGTLTIGNTADATFLNPILHQDAFSSQIHQYIFDSLLGLNEKYEMVPWLATELPVIEDGGKKLTFKLRRDVKWHDGQTFTSKDVRFTFEAILHPTYTGVRASGYTALKGVADLRRQYSAIRKEVSDKAISQEDGDKKLVEAFQKWQAESGAVVTPDDYTVVFQLDQVFAPALGNIALRNIIPFHRLKDEMGAKMKDSEFNRSPIGTGRYSFVEWRTKERIVLKANENWWGGRPHIDQIVIRILPDNNTMMAALERGEVDWAGIDPDQFDRFKNDVKHVQALSYASTRYSQITFDMANDLFNEKAVRHALSHALNKEQMVAQIMQGHAEIAWSHGTPSRWDFNPNVPKYPYDVNKAKQMLDQAGWRPGSDGIRAKDGKKLAFEFYYVGNDKVAQETAQVVQAAWKEVGVEVNLKGIDYTTLLDISDAGNPQRKQPPAYILGWSLGSEPDSYAIWACDGSFNDISYCNKDVDDLLVKGRTTLEQDKRKEFYYKLQEILADDQPYIWLWFTNRIQGLNGRVKGPIVLTPVGIDWNIHHWWIDPNVR
jgi:peptide/nickel transport system substrate-binding protein